MRLTKTSEVLMNFFSKKDCIHPLTHTKKTNMFLVKMYDEIREADKYVTSLKSQTKKINFQLIRINNISEIPRPRLYSDKAFPESVRRNINGNAIYLLTYTFSFYGRHIKFKFIIEEATPEKHIQVYNNYVHAMLLWMYILNDYASKECSTSLSVYLYFTTLKKFLPETNISILDENNVNTAYTTTCPKDSEIIIFRREEWFKVFMHETFHNFALDFSDMNVSESNQKILEIFPVKSDVNLFEAYAEFWAEFMNALFCSYYAMKNKDDPDEFVSNAEYFLNFERKFGFFQMVKTLNFMGLKYKDLYLNNKNSVAVRSLLYKENTSVLSYYVVTLILMNNYQSFLSWCYTNNLSFLQFKKTRKNLHDFCIFIENNYKTSTMLENVECTEDLLHKLKNTKRTNTTSNDNLNFIMNSMRMTICELG